MLTIANASRYFVLWMSIIVLISPTDATRLNAQTYDSPTPSPQENTNNEAAIEVEFGQRRPVVDATGWILGIPQKVLLWDRRVDNHNVSQHTVDSVAEFLSFQELDGVKVRVNQYDPVGEWRRLVSNERIGPGWKYTVGTLTHLRYTILPGRLFGGDEYNPFTNTVHLYSDVPAMGLAESAYASDIHHRKNPGTYAAIQTLPIVSMWHETLATDEVVRYVAIRGSNQEIAEVQKILYARYGVSFGGELGRVLPDGSSVFQVVGAGAGHLAALYENRQLDLSQSDSNRK